MMRSRAEALAAIAGFLDTFPAEPSERRYVEHWQANQQEPTIGELLMHGDFTVLAREAAIAKRPVRTQHPIRIHQAGRLSDEPPLALDSVNVVRAFDSNRRMRRLLDRMRIDHEHGPARGDGDFALLYIAYVHSGEPRLHRWWKQAHGHHSLWNACGFSGPCSYPLLAERFAELEPFAHVFVQMLNELVQAARRHEPMIGAHVVVDGTEVQSHSRLHHACPDGFACPDRNKPRKARFHGLEPGAATAARQAAADIPADEAEKIFKSQGKEVALAALTGKPKNGLRVRLPDGEVLTAWNGHLYSCRDKDAGFRTYDNKTAWNGYYHEKITDTATGLPIAGIVMSASATEFKSLPELYDRLVQATGIKPITLGADRGFGFREVYEFLASNDTGAVIPYRIPGKNGARQPQESAYADIHGIPKCPSCGEPGDVTKTSGASGDGRIWFTCVLKPFDDCEGEHSVMTSKDPLNLVLVPRTSTTYGAIRAASNSNEQAHQYMRDHFAVGGKTLRDRLRRVGIPAQQLRSDAALAILWLLVLRRMKWMERPAAECEPAQARPLRIGRFTERVRRERRRLSLTGGSARTRGAPSERATA